MYIRDTAMQHPDKAAAIRPATGETRSYRELEERSNRLAHLLRAKGLTRGDNVAIYLENTLDFFDVVLAGMRTGLYITPINRHLPASEAAYIVDNCDAKALVASAALKDSEELGRLCSHCPVKLSAGGDVPGFEALEKAIAGYPAEPVDNESLGSFMLYSSGTTGRPKGIKRPLPEGDPSAGHPGSIATAQMWNMDAETVYLSPAPLYHAAPAGYTAAVMQGGGTVVVMDKFDAELALSLIDTHHVTHGLFVPTMFVRMLKLPPDVRARYDMSSLRCAIHAAAPCPIDVKRQMIEWWGPVIEEFYSSTEMAGFTRISSEEWLAHPGSVGRSQGLPFHICDDEGRELPIGEPGAIYGEVPELRKFSYHKDEEKTQGATHPEHPLWRSIGDVGYLDEDGYLYLTDRKAFMIISGGVNIYPQQIEDALALHPKVADVAVIGVPNEDLGEEVKAIVEPAEGVEPTPALAEEIRTFVEAKLGRQLTPRSVDFIDEMPRLATGKLNKKVLRAPYWEKAGSPA
ncbi:acyl-CoA synthetase [Novosphingobium malaysiense]|uniref:Acyl-CoA synthetase n=1 Tax=Novosphingobium malaysiense TaxID=1348853 RepID=A0A0B1ZH72_9SPHN|nr:acyl-CoA synthetase [Novosphingobium malaysiense]KHK89867.1 acyl-CoA synthetase [Novosphingobium malaysiense]